MLGIVAQAFDRGAVGFQNADAEAPALVELRDFEEQRIPPGLESNIHFIGARLHCAGVLCE